MTTYNKEILSYPDDTICRVEDCENPVRAKWLCTKHYARLRKTGTTDPSQWTIDRENGVHNSWNNKGYVCRWRNGKLMLEHRYIMEQHIGRELLTTENVHHVNGVKDDNNIENLELWSTSQPSGQRIVDKIIWAKKLLELYGHDETKWDISPLQLVSTA